MSIESFYGVFNYWAVAVLLLVGIHGMLVRPNLMRKLMAMNVFQVAAIIFWLCIAEKAGSMAPILAHHGAEGAHFAIHAADYVNPLPHALMLTAIVVGVSTTGVALALMVAIHKKYGTLEEPEILELMRLEDDKG